MEATNSASPRQDDDFRWCVLIPTYNNADRIAGVIEGVRVFAGHVLVVNDGSTDGTAAILQSLDVETVTHEVNRGKGQALRTGFSAARSRGFTHAVSMDADGQHHARDLPAMVSAARRAPTAVVIGARNMQAPGVPARNALGGRMSDFGMKMLTGLDVRDSQSGFRVYPLALVEGLRCLSPRFEFEVEILARANHAGATLINVPIGVTYFPEEERVTHFRPWRDTIRLILLDLMLLLPRLLPWYRRRTPPAPAQGATRRSEHLMERDDTPVDRASVPADGDDLPVERASAPADGDDLPVERASAPADRDDLPVERASAPADRDDAPVGRASVPAPTPSSLPTHRQTKPKLGVRALWRKLVRDRTSPIELAVAIGVGVFIGISPLYGLHWLIAIYVAARWHLNVLAVYLGTQISMPLLAPVWAVASVGLGSLIWHQRLPSYSLAEIEVAPFGWAGEQFLLWLLGFPPIGLVVGVVIGLVVYRAAAALQTASPEPSTTPRP